MARLLHRSKSTKEIRTRYELPDEELPRFSAQFSSHTPNKLTRKRAGTILEPKRLSPSKSIPDLKFTIRQGVVAPSPVLPEGYSNAKSLGISNGPAFAIQEPHMGSFPLRSSSKVSLSSSTGTTGIGVAIGSPTKEKHMYIEVRRDTPDVAGHSESASIPSFYLPPEPFNIKGGDWSGKQGNDRNGEPQEARGGWRRLFGRSLFGSRKGATTPAPVPHVPMNEAPMPPKYTPLIAAVASGPTPTLNKLKKEESQARKIADKRTKGQSSSQLLNVEIPTVEMERYSIMFRAQLRDEGPTKLQNTQKPTLYDRRRSRDILGGGSSKERPKLQLEPLKRHATTGGRITPTPNIPDSPHPFSLPTKANKPLQNPTRLARSHTTAALTRDPRPGPGFVLAGISPDTNTVPSAPLQLRANPASIRSDFVDHKTIGEGVGSIGTEGSVVSSSNGSFDEGDDSWLQERTSGLAIPPNVHETGNTLACEEGLHIEDSPLGSIQSLNQSPVKQLSLKQFSQKQSIPLTEEEVMIAAQQSIQRQISISQRQLLCPVVRQKPKPAQMQTPPGCISVPEDSEPQAVNTC